jgi:hypothetical protein
MQIACSITSTKVTVFIYAFVDYLFSLFVAGHWRTLYCPLCVCLRLDFLAINLLKLIRVLFKFIPPGVCFHQNAPLIHYLALINFQISPAATAAEPSLKIEDAFI